MLTENTELVLVANPELVKIVKECLKLQKQAKAEAERKNDLFFERNKIVSEYDSFYIKGSLTLETTEKEYQDLLLDLEAKKQQHIQAQSEIKRLDELQRKRESEKL